MPSLMGLLLLILFIIPGLHAQEVFLPQQCLDHEAPAVDECHFQSSNSGRTLTLLLGKDRFELPLDADGLLRSGESKEYSYNESNNILMVKNAKGGLIWINIDPTGTYASRFLREKFPFNKTCDLVSFPYSYEKDKTRLGRTFKLNGGIMLLRRSTNPRAQRYIIRSMNLGASNFMRMAQKLEAKDVHPPVSSDCLGTFSPMIQKLSCADPDYLKKVEGLRAAIAKTQCRNFLYDGGAGTPLVIHLHASGFGGKEGRGSYALEELKLAQVFGYRFYHPYHKDHPTPLTGGDVFRPVFFQKGAYEERSILNPELFKGRPKTIRTFKVFNFSNHDKSVQELYRDPLESDSLNEKLETVMDKFHFYDPHTMDNFLSKEARACFDLSSELISKRQQDSLKYTGGYQGLFDVLDLILEDKTEQVMFHCHGGRHKTGILGLAIRYLQDPRWMYGPKVKMRFGIKTDSHTGEEKLSWAPNDEAFLERYNWESSARGESKVKNFFQLLFRPESGWFNPAETEYITHNDGQVRLSNLSSTKDLFRLLYEPSNTRHREYLREKYNLDKTQLERMEAKLQELRKKIQSKSCSLDG